MTDNGLYENSGAWQAHAVETEVQKTGWVAAFVAAIKAKIPAGYEDKDGFHFEAEPRLHD